MLADLHIHSCFSDGTFTPEEIVAEAARRELGVVALTDHDTLEGCARLASACRAAGIESIVAVELTAEVENHEVHLLGYFLDPENARLQAELARFQEVRQRRIHEIVARLNHLAIPLTADAVLALANCRAPGRPHVARALVQAGHCGSLDEAFERFLKKGKPAWVPKFKMSAAQAIELIHHAGGLAVMAHPGLYRTDEFIPQLAREGLDGLECFHTKHSTATTEHYLEMAEQLGLLVTGGSDCHGLNKGRPLIGTIKLPGEYVERLRVRVVQRAAASGFLLAASPSPPPQT